MPEVYQLFLSGPLEDDVLRRIVLGAELSLSAARLSVANDSPTRTGGLCAVSEQQRARALFYAEAAELTHVAAKVNCAGAEIEADALLAPADLRQAPLKELSAGWPGGSEDTRAAAQDFMALFDAPGGDPAPLPQRLAQARARAWSRHLAQENRVRSLSPPPKEAPQIQDWRASHFGFFRLDEVALRVPSFAGPLGPPIKREVFAGYDGALVLPYDAARNEVLLVEQFRLGLWRRGDPSPWTLEPIAGMVDAGEAPRETARREALEEAGLELNWIAPVASVYASPGYNADYFHCFVAGADLAGLDGHIGGAIGEAEDIRAHVIGLPEALGMIETGEINVAPLVMMLLWLDRNQTRWQHDA